jgi:hypothetical protein
MAHATSNQRRKAAYAKLALGRKQLGWDDAFYYGIWLPGRGAGKKEGKYSATTLDDQGLAAAIRDMERCGARFEKPKRALAGRPNNIERNPQLQKIEALLADAKRPWTYLTAPGKPIRAASNRPFKTPRGENAGISLLERLTGKQRLEFCDGADLGKVIAALEIDAKRRVKQ